MIELLLDVGDNINRKDNTNSTALHWAARQGLLLQRYSFSVEIMPIKKRTL